MKSIGYSKNGKTHFNFSYKLKKLFFNLRESIALFICPELYNKDRERYNLDYLIYMYKQHAKDVRARDKAIAKLQKERKNFQFLLKQAKDESCSFKNKG